VTRTLPATVAGGPGTTVLNIKGTEVGFADDAFAPQPGTTQAFAAVKVGEETVIIVRNGTGEPYTYELITAETTDPRIDMQAIIKLITEFQTAAAQKAAGEAQAAIAAGGQPAPDLVANGPTTVGQNISIEA